MNEGFKIKEANVKDNYSISFQGELKSGFNIEETKAQLKADYQLDDTTLTQWFSGESVTLRASVKEEDLPQFRQYFEALGMVLYITPHSWIKSADRDNDELDSDFDPDFDLIDPPEEDELIRKEPRSSEKHDSIFDRATQSETSDAETLKATLEELKEAIKDNKHTFLFRPANLGIRVIAFMIDFFIFVFLLGMIIQFILMPIGVIDPLFTELSQYLVNGVGSGVLDAAQLQNISSTDALMEYIGKSMNLTPDLIERFKTLDVTKEKNMISLSAFLFSCLYFGLLESSKMQTSLGKRLFNLRVYSLNSPKMRLSQAFLRVLLFTIVINIGQALNGIVPGIGTILLVIALGIAFFDKRGLRQTLFDRLSNTCVGYDLQTLSHDK